MVNRPRPRSTHSATFPDVRDCGSVRRRTVRQREFCLGLIRQPGSGENVRARPCNARFQKRSHVTQPTKSKHVHAHDEAKLSRGTKTKGGTEANRAPGGRRSAVRDANAVRRLGKRSFHWSRDQKEACR
jgi:hypothetical protein